MLLLDSGKAATMAVISRPRHYAIETLYWFSVLLPFALFLCLLSVLALPFFWIMTWWMQTFVRPAFGYLHSLHLQPNLIFMLLVPMSMPLAFVPLLLSQIMNHFRLWKDLERCFENAIECGFEAYNEWLDDLAFCLRTRGPARGFGQGN
jgi:hypothetical protein